MTLASVGIHVQVALQGIVLMSAWSLVKCSDASESPYNCPEPIFFFKESS